MVRIAAAQIKITNSPYANLEKILKYIKRASSEEADLVVFPEICLIHRKDELHVKTTFFRELLGHIKAACNRNNVSCLFGSYTYENSKVCNTAILVSHKGRVISKYRKTKLFLKEKGKVTPGKEPKALKTHLGKIGIIICWDIAYPELVKRLSAKGCWLILCPSYIKNYGRDLESYLQIPYVRAFENSACVVATDSANKECARYTTICTPSMKKELRNREGLLTAEIDKKEITKARKRYELV